MQKKISWKFNPPYSSHFGGFFEREIRTVRKILFSILTSQNIRLSDENLCTVMCEIESIMNNRPLTEITSDPSDSDALTPNHLLLLNAGITLPPGLFKKSDCYLSRRWRQVQYLADMFWSKWRREYLVLLNQRQKWTNTERSLRPGDLVLVSDVALPRNQWPLGRVLRVHPDASGRVRSASVNISKFKNAKAKDFSCSTVLRPITKLVFLKNFEE